jgi:hypothetical protein
MRNRYTSVHTKTTSEILRLLQWCQCRCHVQWETSQEVFFSGIQASFQVKVEPGQVLVFKGDAKHGGVAYDIEVNENGKRLERSPHLRESLHLHIDPIGFPRDKKMLQFDFSLPGIPADYVIYAYKEKIIDKKELAGIVGKRLGDMGEFKTLLAKENMLKTKTPGDFGFGKGDVVHLLHLAQKGSP